jgi:hypothetical protein
MSYVYGLHHNAIVGSIPNFHHEIPVYRTPLYSNFHNIFCSLKLIIVALHHFVDCIHMYMYMQM